MLWDAQDPSLCLPWCNLNKVIRRIHFDMLTLDDVLLNLNIIMVPSCSVCWMQKTTIKLSNYLTTSQMVTKDVSGYLLECCWFWKNFKTCGLARWPTGCSWCSFTSTSRTANYWTKSWLCQWLKGWQQLNVQQSRILNKPHFIGSFAKDSHPT